jgi:hypothetical protein
MAGRTLTVYLAADTSKFRSGMIDASNDAEGFRGKLGGLANNLTNMLGPALIGAGVAAGAMAVKLGVEGVQAAIEDEKAAAKLAKTLENVGLAHDTAKVEDYIDSMQRATGVADDELRPAYDRLIRSIGDTKQANDALALAMDISAGTGKSLDAVVQALGKAYDGNTGALGKLGAGIDTAILKTGDMEQITAALAKTFGGQAAEQAKTWQGQIDRLSIAFDELKESFGQGFLDSLGSADNALGADGLTGTMKELEPAVRAVGDSMGDSILVLRDLALYTKGAYDSFDAWRKQLEGPLKVAVDAITLAIEQTTNPLKVAASAVNTLKAAYDALIDTYNRWKGAEATRGGEGSSAGGGGGGGGSYRDVGAINKNPTPAPPAVVTTQATVQTLNQVINNSNNRTGSQYTTAQLYAMGVLH